MMENTSEKTELMMTSGDQVKGATPSEGMTDGDVRAMAEREFPVGKEPRDLYMTTSRILPAARRVIAVSGKALASNQEIAAYSKHMPVIEIWEINTKGSYEKYDAAFLTNVRHVEILGPSWVFHDPYDKLGGADKRSAVMETHGPLRVYEDTEAQQERMKDPFGC